MKWFNRKKKPNRLKTDEQPRRYGRAVAWTAGALVAVAAGVIGLNYLEQVDWERFRTLEITGELEHVSPERVQAALAPYLANGFASIDMRQAREAVEDLPWVAAAAMRRRWPGELVVELREQAPVATWFGTALLNAQGEVFVDGAIGYSGVLPDIGGPRGAQRDMIERLEAMRLLTGESGLKLRRLLRTDRRAERFWLDNGIEVRLGRRDVDARLHRFLETAWPALKARANEVAYVDMRYTNGFAVGWKTASRREG